MIHTTQVFMDCAVPLLRDKQLLLIDVLYVYLNKIHQSTEDVCMYVCILKEGVAALKSKKL